MVMSGSRMLLFDYEFVDVCYISEQFNLVFRGFFLVNIAYIYSIIKKLHLAQTSSNCRVLNSPSNDCRDSFMGG